MAGQAAKKAQKAGQSLSTRLHNSIVPINVVYILYRIVWHYSSFSNWHMWGYGLLLTMTYMSYTMAVGSALQGTNNEYPKASQICLLTESIHRYAMDVLLITLGVQIGSMFTDYFWYIYLVIPGYVIYYGGRMLWGFAFPQGFGASDDSVKEATVSKRQAKLEKRGVRQRAPML
ncbi:hypothetical protein ACHHYP_13119 [Achlya hypogyna]|uniref:Transmembrane protein n=1 Tax=Achlya hypogyna TaxID=1202772 RepID=A0A1V9YG09_ACHHY|nr:hypothetical protein ACHHYP_13119 [Achlya hypogyna]